MKQIILIVLILTLASSKKSYFGKCQCKSGEYYEEDSGTCKPNITPTVENCRFSPYEDGKIVPSKCSSCKHNFWLESETKCTAIETADQVTNCEFQNEKKKCYQCNNTYRPYDNYTKCGSVPENCSLLDSQNAAITCQSCNNKYTLNGTKCEAVTNDIANCAEWSKKTTCNGCEKGYFLESETKCTAQVTVANCKQLYQSSKGCRDCEWGYSRNDDKTICAKGTIVDCELHEDRDVTKCKYCKQGYKLNADQNSCTAITPKPTDFDENCQTYDHESKCIGCVYDYQWEVDEDGDGDYEIYPKYGYTTSVQTCSQKCPSMSSVSGKGSNSAILSFTLASIALIVLLF